MLLIRRNLILLRETNRILSFIAKRIFASNKHTHRLQIIGQNGHIFSLTDIYHFGFAEIIPFQIEIVASPFQHLLEILRPISYGSLYNPSKL